MKAVRNINRTCNIFCHIRQYCLDVYLSFGTLDWAECLFMWKCDPSVSVILFHLQQVLPSPYI